MELLSNCCGARVDGLNAENMGICSECKEGCGVEEVGEKEKYLIYRDGHQFWNLEKGIIALIEREKVRAKSEGEYIAYDDIVETILADDDTDILKYAQEERAKLSKLSEPNQ